MEKAFEIATDYGIDPLSPRMGGRQQHLNNVPADTPSAYWKRAMYLPFLDHLVTEINEMLVVPLPGFQAQLLIPGKHLTLPWLQEFCGSCSFDHSVVRLLFLLIGKLGQLTEEKLKSIHAHYGGDMAIDLEQFKLKVNKGRPNQQTTKGGTAGVGRNSRCS